MPFIPLNLKDVQEARPVPIGMYDLTIVECEEGVSKNGFPQFVATISIEGHPDAPPLMHYASIPTPDDEPKKMNGKMLFLSRFLHVFGVAVDPKGFDTTAICNELRGAKGRCPVVLDETGEYNRLNPPKLPDAGTQETGRRAPPPPKR